MALFWAVGAVTRQNRSRRPRRHVWGETKWGILGMCSAGRLNQPMGDRYSLYQLPPDDVDVCAQCLHWWQAHYGDATTNAAIQTRLLATRKRGGVAPSPGRRPRHIAATPSSPKVPL